MSPSVNQKQPGTVNLDDLVGRDVGNAYVQFIVHPSNPVQSLSKAQLAGLFSGQIGNWSEVGGPNRAVMLVGEPTSAATPCWWRRASSPRASSIARRSRYRRRKRP